eukprot:TRINITY_DN18568_c0_g1_i2.p1 TRINITY_DN18568_c0_g1~~TRINITY_DN18568_c0_g1_i2.p1  ORF type:complete len:249 (+),score=14.12 TRINITY_DN18568_c0_g1_i2:224-970(+)
MRETPKEEFVRSLATPSKLVPRLEEARWDALDNQNVFPQVSTMTIANFLTCAFTHCDLLGGFHQYLPCMDRVLLKASLHKATLDLCGCFCVDTSGTHVIVVQAYGNNTWGLPMGKKNDDETELNAAIREVKEETGLEIGRFLNPSKRAEMVIGRRKVIVFFCSGIPLSVPLHPQTKNEISCIAWHPIADIYQHPQQYWGVAPISRELTTWVGRPSTRKLGTRRIIAYTNNNPTAQREVSNQRQYERIW